MPIEKRWVVKPQGDAGAVAALSAALKLSPVLANLLVQRGIDTVERARVFFAQPRRPPRSVPDEGHGEGGRAGGAGRREQ